MSTLLRAWAFANSELATTKIVGGGIRGEFELQHVDCMPSKANAKTNIFASMLVISIEIAF